MQDDNPLPRIIIEDTPVEEQHANFLDASSGNMEERARAPFANDDNVDDAAHILTPKGTSEPKTKWFGQRKKSRATPLEPANLELLERRTSVLHDVNISPGAGGMKQMKLQRLSMTPDKRFRRRISDEELSKIDRKNSVEYVVENGIPRKIENGNVNSITAMHIKSIKELLLEMGTNAKVQADLHNLAVSYCNKYNSKFSIVILSVSLISSVANPILEKYGKAIHVIFTTTMFALIGSLNVMYNYLAYSTRAEQHKHARDAFLQIVEVIDIAMAVEQEKAGSADEFRQVMTEVQQLRHHLTSFCPELPSYIVEKYSKILLPSISKNKGDDESEDLI